MTRAKLTKLLIKTALHNTETIYRSKVIIALVIVYSIILPYVAAYTTIYSIEVNRFVSGSLNKEYQVPPDKINNIISAIEIPSSTDKLKYIRDSITTSINYLICLLTILSILLSMEISRIKSGFSITWYEKVYLGSYLKVFLLRILTSMLVLLPLLPSFVMTASYYGSWFALSGYNIIVLALTIYFMLVLVTSILAIASTVTRDPVVTVLLGMCLLGIIVIDKGNIINYLFNPIVLALDISLGITDNVYIILFLFYPLLVITQVILLCKRCIGR